MGKQLGGLSPQSKCGHPISLNPFPYPPQQYPCHGPRTQIHHVNEILALRATSSPRSLNTAFDYLTNLATSLHIHQHHPVRAAGIFHLGPFPVLSAPRNQGSAFVSLPCLNSSLMSLVFRTP